MSTVNVVLLCLASYLFGMGVTIVALAILRGDR